MISILTLLAASVYAKRECVDGALCVITKMIGAELCFTVHSVAQGWTAVGLGERMAGADIYVGWKNSTGGWTISNRAATGYSLPTLNSKQQAYAVPIFDTTPAPSFAQFSFAFCRLANASPEITASSSYVFAASDAAPASLDDASSSFEKHNLFQRAQVVDLTEGKPATSGTGGPSATPTKMNSAIGNSAAFGGLLSSFILMLL